MAAAALVVGATAGAPTPQRRLSPPRPNPQFPRQNTPLRHPSTRASGIRPISAALRSPPNPSTDDEKTNPVIPEALRAALLAGFLMAANPLDAHARTGGRVGGRLSSSSHSRSSSRSSSLRRRIHSSSRSRPSSSSSTLSSENYSSEIGTPSQPVEKDGRLLYLVLEFSILLSILLSLLVYLSSPEKQKNKGSSSRPTIHKIQVGLSGMARSLQKNLDQIAEIADTSTLAGLHRVLTETGLALLEHPQYYISAYSSVDTKQTVGDWERRFDQLSLEERAKIDEETLVNVNSIKKQKKNSQESKGFNNEYIVITIIVATEGEFKLPVINGSADLKEVLQKLAVEVLWTPQDENDILTEHELLKDYPLLRPLH